MQCRVVSCDKRIFFRTLSFCCKANFRSVKIRGYFFHEIVRVASSPKVRFEVDDVVIECRILQRRCFEEVSGLHFLLVPAFLTPVGGRKKNVYWKVSAGKCVRMSRIPV